MIRDHSHASFPFAQPNPDVPLSAGIVDGNHNGCAQNAPLSEAQTAAALHSLKEELANLPHREKSSLVHAQQINPDLVDDEHLLSFLHAECFDVGLALKRLARYWDHRYKVFGPEYFALPMTLNGAMKGHMHAVEHGFLLLLPVVDEAGRAIIYYDPSVFNERVLDAEEKIKVWWYLIHVAMEDPSVRKKGFVLLIDTKYARLKNFDTQWALALFSSADRDFPIRMKITHVCRSSAIFPLIASAVKAVLSPDQRETYILHNGTEESVLESLAEYMLPEHCIPTSLGGSLQVSANEFLQERLEIEESTAKGVHQNLTSCSETGSGMIDVVNQKVIQEDIPAVADLTSSLHETGIQSAAASVAAPTNVSVQQKRGAKIMGSGTKRGKAQTTRKSSCGRRKGNGRQGDPRMNRAMQLMIENPGLSTLAALQGGGFVFPGLNAPGVKNCTVRDTDNITLFQRRNQLMRRLRLAKDKGIQM